MCYMVVAYRDGLYPVTFLGRTTRTYARKRAFRFASYAVAAFQRDFFQNAMPGWTWTVVPMVGGGK